MSFLRAAPKQRRQRPLGPNDPRRSTGERQGLLPYQVSALFEQQQGLCAVGGEPLNRETMVVDHCHQCANAHGHDASKGCPKCFRGLVCQRHNSALGWLGDNFDALRRAALYVGHGTHR